MVNCCNCDWRQARDRSSQDGWVSEATIASWNRNCNQSHYVVHVLVTITNLTWYRSSWKVLPLSLSRAVSPCTLFVLHNLTLFLFKTSSPYTSFTFPYRSYCSPINKPNWCNISYSFPYNWCAAGGDGGAAQVDGPSMWPSLVAVSPCTVHCVVLCVDCPLLEITHSAVGLLPSNVTVAVSVGKTLVTLKL